VRAPVTPLTIGGMTAGTAMHRGAVDEVRLYRGAMSSQQLKREVCATSSEKAICAE